MKKLKKVLLITGIVLVALFMLFLIIPVSDSGTKETSSEKETEESAKEEKQENTEPNKIQEPVIESKDTTDNDFEWMYNIIPYSTYESGGDDLHLYMNLVWNEDDSIDLYGFGYSYDEVADDYEVVVHLTPDPDYENVYISDFRNFYVGIYSDHISVDSDGNEEGNYAFTGSFRLVADGTEAFTGDFVELSFEETADFFRDKNNIGETFRCRFFYYGRDTFETMGVDYHKFSFRYDNGNNTISFLVYADAKETDPIFYDGEDIIVTGIYLGDKEGAGYSGFNIELISMELFN